MIRPPASRIQDLTSERPSLLDGAEQVGSAQSPGLHRSGSKTLRLLESGQSPWCCGKRGFQRSGVNYPGLDLFLASKGKEQPAFPVERREAKHGPAGQFFQYINRFDRQRRYDPAEAFLFAGGASLVISAQGVRQALSDFRFVFFYLTVFRHGFQFRGKRGQMYRSGTCLTVEVREILLFLAKHIIDQGLFLAQT